LEDKKMKTKLTTNRAARMISALFAVSMTAASAMAQPDPDAKAISNVQEAFNRLDALMITVEHAVRYAAPAAVYDDIRSAWERLELLADNTEREIRYEVPVEGKSIPETFATNENHQEFDEGASLTRFTAMANR
jgi:hypothetical protein